MYTAMAEIIAPVISPKVITEKHMIKIVGTFIVMAKQLATMKRIGPKMPNLTTKSRIKPIINEILSFVTYWE